jgi:hypothetical protein
MLPNRFDFYILNTSVCIPMSNMYTAGTSYPLMLSGIVSQDRVHVGVLLSYEHNAMV